MTRILRTITLFRDTVNSSNLKELERLVEIFEKKGFKVQTRRICYPSTVSLTEVLEQTPENVLVSMGTIDPKDQDLLYSCVQSGRIVCNVDLTDGQISVVHTDVLFSILQNNPSSTFNFAYVFNNPESTPYFPSANYLKDGFAVGLQPTNLSKDCDTLDEWFENMKTVWDEIMELMKNEPDFLGIDSSVAPLFEDDSSLINFVKRLQGDFSSTVTTDIYTKITWFIKNQNPKPFGLCGLMFPCLEDFDLADEYAAGNFSIERNVFLSLHSGLGIDTYPIGVDEEPVRVLEILKLIQALSNKYSKPLSVRFVSDGKAKIGEMSDFQNQYLKDIVVRKL